MTEDFGRLLAVGYLGFDVQVDEDGMLGPPVATLDVLEDRPGAKKRLFQSLSTESRQVVESQVREIYIRMINIPANTSPAMDAVHRQLDAFGNKIVIPAGLPCYVQSSPTNLPEVVGDIATKVERLTGFTRYSNYRGALYASLEGIGCTSENATLEAHRKLLKKADEDLTKAFETSDHVALALKLYCDEVLTRH
jgi:hypothetical protein